MTSTDDQGIKQARAAIARIPLLASHDPHHLNIERLGGLTNLVFRVADGQQTWCLRLAGPGTEEYINRAHEAVAAREAASADVSPEVLFFDEDSGLMLARFIDDAVTMSAQGFRDRAGAPARAATAFRKLHDSPARFPFRFELFSMVDDYLRILADKPVDLPEGYHDVLASSNSVREALQAAPLPLAACHCDPLCENFLDTGERMWIVDWEYSGMNDPMWDLGDLSVEAGFSGEQDAQMLHAYFQGEAAPADRGRMVIYKAMCDLLWTLWGLIQHVNNNPAEDFWAYSIERFERCKTLMAKPEFESHVQAVRDSAS